MFPTRIPLVFALFAALVLLFVTAGQADAQWVPADRTWTDPGAAGQWHFHQPYYYYYDYSRYPGYYYQPRYGYGYSYYGGRWMGHREYRRPGVSQLGPLRYGWQ